MNDFKHNESAYNDSLLEEVTEIINQGNLSALDRFMYSNKGYRFGHIFGSSRTENILALAMERVLDSGKSDVLLHVLSNYNLVISKAMSYLTQMDINNGLPIPHRIQHMRHLVRDILSPLLLDNAQNYKSNVEHRAGQLHAWTVWMALNLETDYTKNTNLINTFIDGLISTNAKLNSEDPIDNDNLSHWVQFMMDNSDDTALIEASRRVSTWDSFFLTTLIHNEFPRRMMIRDTVAQGNHRRLGVNSPLRLLNPDLLKSTLDYAYRQHPEESFQLN